MFTSATKLACGTKVSDCPLYVSEMLAVFFTFQSLVLQTSKGLYSPLSHYVFLYNNFKTHCMHSQVI